MDLTKIYTVFFAMFAWTTTALADVPPQKMSQMALQVEAAKLNDRASDLSMENATGFAMKAVMDLASLNIGGAIRNGVTSYGNCRNSESLDDLTDRNIVDAYMLTSLAEPGHVVFVAKDTSFLAGGARKFGSERTTFRRLDKKFLYTGEMNELAKQFEKKTGLTREQFFDVLAAASEEKISPDDSQVVEKSMARLRGFVSMIPNEKIQARLKELVDEVPEFFQRGVVANSISQATTFAAESGAIAGSGESVAGAPETRGLASTGALTLAGA